MNKQLSLSLLLALTVGLTACGGKTDDATDTGGGGTGGSCTDTTASDTVIVPLQNKLLAETAGTELVTSLPAGNYRLVLSSSGHGLHVEWIGAPSCPTYSEASYYDNSCAVPAGGGVRITNPNTDRSYGDEHFSVKLTKPASACLVSGTKVVEESDQVISDGNQRTYSFNAGTYHVVASTPGHGVSLAWTGASCVNLGESASLDSTCTVPDGGTLTVVNPSANGWGDEHLKITVTKTN